MKFKKRIAALSVVAMMITSATTINATANQENNFTDNIPDSAKDSIMLINSSVHFSLYISISGTVTSQVCDVGNVTTAGKIKLNVDLTSRTKGSSVSFRTHSAGYQVGYETKATLGSEIYSYSDDYIDVGDRVIVTTTLNPGPNTSVSAGGTVALL